jgi:hypothetical protein
MAGYSGTPLAQKLGIKPGERIVAIGAPAHYRDLLSEMPADAVVTNRISRAARFIHLFVQSRAELARRLSGLREKIDDAGTLWLSWPKKSSGISTDVTEDVIREEALPLGFVDVKVCAVDDTWSGLKLMIRRTERKAN